MRECVAYLAKRAQIEVCAGTDQFERKGYFDFR